MTTKSERAKLGHDVWVEIFEKERLLTNLRGDPTVHDRLCALVPLAYPSPHVVQVLPESSRKSSSAPGIHTGTAL